MLSLTCAPACGASFTFGSRAPCSAACQSWHPPRRTINESAWPTAWTHQYVLVQLMEPMENSTSPECTMLYSKIFNERQRRQAQNVILLQVPTTSLPHPHPVSKSAPFPSRGATTFWFSCVREDRVGRAAFVSVFQMDAYDVQCELPLVRSEWLQDACKLCQSPLASHYKPA